MSRDTSKTQVSDDQELTSNSVLSNLTSDELQIVDEICDLDLQGADIGTNCPSKNIGGEQNTLNPTVTQAMDSAPADSHGYWTSDAYLDKSFNTSDVLIDKSEQNENNTIEIQRIEEIKSDLMKYDQLGEAPQSGDLMWQLGLVEKNKTIPALQTSSEALAIGEFDACTSWSTMYSASGITCESFGIAPTSEFNGSTFQYTANYANEMMEQPAKNIINMESTATVENQSEYIDNTKEIEESSKIYSIEIRSVYPTSKNSNICKDSGSICTPVLPEVSEEEEQTAGRYDTQGSNDKSPPTKSGTPKIVYPEIRKLLSTTNFATIIGEAPSIRSSSRKRRHVSASGSREDMVRARYSNLEELRKQAESHKPDLNHPFWRNLKAFVCARSVFWKKEKRGIICPFPYVGEKHGNLGYKINSRHVLIRSYKNPQMPVCTICHERRYHVQDAEKCEFCVKAYFESNIELEQGEIKEILDVWP
ncbi:hypothetical protein QAD02_007467 [Eretmocerus hayati]|uniref:Uncharacterized protein n=1 Tax=Eretmocerus hayati TaxID=131215 RepID=A0ACC2N819_9HYME|nr:hypothetical protein QAD02_007467 [Eretmocerus hayati]